MHPSTNTGLENTSLGSLIEAATVACGWSARHCNTCTIPDALQQPIVILSSETETHGEEYTTASI